MNILRRLVRSWPWAAFAVASAAAIVVVGVVYVSRGSTAAPPPAPVRTARSATPVRTPPAAYPLKPDPNGRYLIDQHNRPFHLTSSNDALVT